MKQSKEMPEEGQFVGLWVYGRELWSSTFMVDIDGLLFEFNDHEDSFQEVDREDYKDVDMTYFVKD